MDTDVEIILLLESVLDELKAIRAITERVGTEPPTTKEKSLRRAVNLLTPPLKELWNTYCGALPKITTVTDKRQKAWIARWGSKPDFGYWVGVVQKIANNPFCCGENDRDWRATVDFLLRPDTHVRVSEGLYDRNGAAKHGSKIEYDIDGNVIS
jgi:hypothetical protein